jgi:hypothetical protein
VATIASVNELEANQERTFVFNDPIISIAKSIAPFNYGLRAYPSLESISTNVNLKQIEPRTIFASKHSSWVNELHGFSGRTAGFTGPERLTQRKSKLLIEGFVCNPLFCHFTPLGIAASAH